MHRVWGGPSGPPLFRSVTRIAWESLGFARQLSQRRAFGSKKLPRKWHCELSISKREHRIEPGDPLACPSAPMDIDSSYITCELRTQTCHVFFEDKGNVNPMTSRRGVKADHGHIQVGRKPVFSETPLLTSALFSFFNAVSEVYPRYPRFFLTAHCGFSYDRTGRVGLDFIKILRLRRSPKSGGLRVCCRSAS